MTREESGTLCITAWPDSIVGYRATQGKSSCELLVVTSLFIQYLSVFIDQPRVLALHSRPTKAYFRPRWLFAQVEQTLCSIVCKKESHKVSWPKVDEYRTIPLYLDNKEFKKQKDRSKEIILSWRNCFLPFVDKAQVTYRRLYCPRSNDASVRRWRDSALYGSWSHVQSIERNTWKTIVEKLV